jgi:hypothetical protein
MATTSTYSASLQNLTALEIKALVSAYESSAGNGHDFGYTDDIVIPGKSKQVVGGVIASLLKKGIISRDPEFGQFCFANFGYYKNDQLDCHQAAELVRLQFIDPTPAPVMVKKSIPEVLNSLTSDAGKALAKKARRKARRAARKAKKAAELL